MRFAERMARWGASPAARIAGRAARLLFFAGMVAWLALKVRAIGWERVISAMPTQPLFYGLFAVMFLALPLSEMLVFRRLLGRPIPGAFPAFIRKRVFNAALVGYSGELYLFIWARRRLGIAPGTLMVALKDNAILSALASAMVTSVLLVIFVATGRTRWIADWLHSAAGWLIGAVLVVAFLVPIAVRLRRRILGAAAATAGAVLAIHVARILLVVLLQATQWSVALPSEPWSVWVTFLTVQMVISRLPLVPNRDLMFLSAALEMSHVADGSRVAMAGLLLAGGALTQGTNLLFFVLTGLERRRGGAASGLDDDAVAAADVAPPGVPPTAN